MFASVLLHQLQFLPVCPWHVAAGHVHHAGMGLAGGPGLHQEPELPRAGKGDQVVSVQVRIDLRQPFARQTVLHHDVRFTVIGVEGGGEGALQDRDGHRHLGGAHPIDVEHVLPAVAAGGETGRGALAIHQVQDLVVRRVHREVQVLRRTEDVQAGVVRAAEHIVPAHAVVPLRTEEEALPIRVHERIVLILIRVHVAGQLHRGGERPVRQQFGAVDVATGAAVLAVAAEVDGTGFVRQIDEPALLALLVQVALQFLGEHHDLPPYSLQVVEPEELGGGDLELVVHGHVLDVAQQPLSVAALLLQVVHRPLGQQFPVGHPTVVLVGLQGLVEPVGQVVGPAKLVPGQRRHRGVLHGVLQEADGLVLVLAPMDYAGAQAVVEVPVVGLQAHQLGVMRHGLGVAALIEQGIGLGA